MTPIKLVVLDMAGTTINENNIVYKTLQKAINCLGYTLSLEVVLKYGAGKEKHQAIKDILKNCTSSDSQTIEKKATIAFSAFKIELEKAYDTFEINTFEGIPLFFEKLKRNGIKIVLNTGYDTKTANKLLTLLNWKIGYEIDALITADDVVNGRPHPDMILKAMTLFNITNPAEVLKAGDSEIDILEGKNAKCGITIGVLSGAQTKKQLETANPNYILNYVTDIEKILFH